MKNVTKNFFYQAIFQLTKILIPIITVPIVSQALGPRGVGIYNFTFSVAQYFVLVAGLGITLYGNRQIALAAAKQEDLSEKFGEIFTLKALFTGACLLVYFSLVLAFFPHKLYYLAQSLTIIAVLVDVSWFFMGIEDFKKTSLSNLAVQVVTFLLIVLFVNDQSDALLYTVIQASGIFLSQLLVWVFLKRYLVFKPVSLKKSWQHLAGATLFFIPQMAILLYTNLNKTLLGLMVGESAVGYYANSIQLIDVFITVITTLDVVLLPHMSGLFAKNHRQKIVGLMGTTIHLQLFFSIPIMFGMLTVYDKLVPWFFGRQFLFIEKVIPWIVGLIVIKSLGISISRQYLMPVGKVGEYNKSVVIGALINIGGNVVLLPSLGFWGVIISMLVAECFVTLTRAYSFVKTTQFSFQKSWISLYLLAGLVMCVVTRLVTQNMAASLLTNLIQVLIAAPIYLLLTSVFKVNPLVTYLHERWASKK